MLRRELLGDIILEGTAEEIRSAWPKTAPELRYQFWMPDEITAHILDDPAQLQSCIAAKRAKPGRLD